MTISQNLTTRNYTKYSGLRKIEYIVIHYTANNGDTAKANSNYFKTEYRGGSAHYFVDEYGVYQAVRENDISWHCGGGLQGSSGHVFYQKCTNVNSIGIELCSRNSNGDGRGATDPGWYFKDETLNNARELVKQLMKKYNIPVDRVIRHYDVTGKWCPAPFVNDDQNWNLFKERLLDLETGEDIIEEFAKHGIVSDKAYWLDIIQKDSNIYWLCKKTIKYISQYCETNIKRKLDEYSDENDLLWELLHRKIITDVPLWRQKIQRESDTTYYLIKKSIHYIRTHE